MKISKYFETAIGRGVLATADATGRIDIALYARPHVIDEETIAFCMLNRTTHKNLQSNPHAAYLFLEEGPEHNGKRLLLTKIKEEEEGDLIESLRKKTYPELKEKVEHLIYFKVDCVLPLVEVEEREVIAART
jgi:hypothetical protein